MASNRKSIYTRYIPFSTMDIMENVINIDRTYIDLIDEIKKQHPDAKLVFGFLNQNQLELCEFILIFKYNRVIDKKQTTLYTIFNATKFGYRSLECYDLCKKNGHKENFFKEFYDQSVVYPEKVFQSLIIDELGLSFNKTSKKYWKNLENSPVIIEKLGELCSSNNTLMQARR